MTQPFAIHRADQKSCASQPQYSWVQQAIEIFKNDAPP
ncbi:hypothetical protein AM1_6088 [Acaryochloris marina MBIC11017]|uniref:Uncharacterized protein n=1 Tax=Acaryochloris marina (strain MBIC 11017) TaxID=329726 RepID=B0C3T2_ACAM1|nr:hypothetical protein AM1_6088 [Acaryochloris marina MBIC11017]